MSPIFMEFLIYVLHLLPIKRYYRILLKVKTMNPRSHKRFKKSCFYNYNKSIFMIKYFQFRRF